jgi:hypothetical protein
MNNFTLRSSLALGAAAFSVPAWSAELDLKLALPRLTVAEYHRPYVTVWLEKAGDQSFAGHLAVLYDLKKPNNGGTKWLKDMRQWWRKGGRDLNLPADGVSGATRAPGEQVLSLGKAPALANLAPGTYEVVVEAAREAGGREVLRLPLQWPPKATAKPATAQGEHELGALSLSAKP